MAWVKSFLRFKGLDLISEADSDTIREWHQEIYKWGGIADAIGEAAIGKIQKGSDFYAIVDDKTEELVAICSYEIIDEPFPPAESKFSHDEYIYITYLAGVGKGGAYGIAKDVMQLGEIENIPVVLESTEEALGFYKKLGFTPVRYDDWHWFYYLPSSAG